MAFVCVVAATHFHIGSDSSLDMNENEIKTASDGVQLLYRLVSSFYGRSTSLVAVRPEYIMSTHISKDLKLVPKP